MGSEIDFNYLFEWAGGITTALSNDCSSADKKESGFFAPHKHVAWSISLRNNIQGCATTLYTPDVPGLIIAVF